MTTVVLTREAGSNGELRTLLSRDYRVIEVPATSTTYVEPGEFARQVATLPFAGRYESVLLTSARASRYLEVALSAAVASCDVGVVGEKTKEAVANLGLSVTFSPAVATGRELARLVRRDPVLVVGASAMRDEVASTLVARNRRVSTLACYETVLNELTIEQQRIVRDADVVVVGAPSAWRALRDSVSPACLVVARGETTASVVAGDHPKVDVAWGNDIATLLAERFS